MSVFDAAIYVALIVAMIVGFNSGLLRSLATIFGYLGAMPVALAAAPWLSLIMIRQFYLPLGETWWLVLCGTFVAAGLVLGALLRWGVSVIVGPTVSIVDRLAGSVLGAIRVGLLAVLMVVIFDRMIPPGREPDFLAQSRLRPVLSAAGQQGLKSLPRDAASLIDRLKRDRGL